MRAAVRGYRAGRYRAAVGAGTGTPSDRGAPPPDPALAAPGPPSPQAGRVRGVNAVRSDQPAGLADPRQMEIAVAEGLFDHGERA